MSNFDTRFVNFLAVLLVLGLMSSLSGCSPETKNKISNTNENVYVIGGEPVDEASRLANKVIYIALGVEKKKTPFGFTISQQGVCTGSALSTKVILTAAHCLKNYSTQQIMVVNSLNPWGQPLDVNQWIEAAELIPHPDYKKNQEASPHDLALIRLKSALPIEKISTLATAEIATMTQLNIIATGYGETSSLNNESPELSSIQNQKTLLYLVDKVVSDFQQQNLLFSIDQSDGKGICHGDSGGPGLIYDLRTDEYKILGVASFVSILESEKNRLDPQNKFNFCIGKGHYTNVLPYLGWINKTLGQLKALN